MYSEHTLEGIFALMLMSILEPGTGCGALDWDSGNQLEGPLCQSTIINSRKIGLLTKTEIHFVNQGLHKPTNQNCILKSVEDI